MREAGLDPMKLVVVASTGHGERAYALSKQARQALAA